MAFGRNKSVLKYDDFLNRIQRTFYFGGTVEELKLPLPLASYASELFSRPHQDYSLNRLSTYNACKIQASPCSLIMALIFLERLNTIDPCFVKRVTPHELFILSMMISTKFYVGHDEEVYLSDWALEGNMTENKLKQLEIEFLCAINWNIYISKEEFFKKLSSVEKSLAEREGLRRGWLTYTELMQLMPSLTLTKYLVNALFNHIAVLLVSYAAGVLTIVGAFFLASQIQIGNRARDLLGSTEMAVINETLNETDSNLTGTSIMTGMEQQNTTCNALNVEAELLKLENNYKAEQKAEELLNRNNELNHVAYSILPVGGRTQSTATLEVTKQEHKWLIFKETYTDRSRCILKGSDNQTKDLNKYAKKTPLHLYDCFKHFGNCTSFWQIISDTNQKSFVHLPLLWFKFI